MALSDKLILENMEIGDIVIDPFNISNLGTSSYDVRLGEWYYREQKPYFNTGYYNIYDKEQVEKVWGKAEVAIDMYLPEATEPWTGIPLRSKVIFIEPGETILAHTEEFIGGKHHLTTMMKARSSFGRNFIEICKCAGWGDVGYTNRWTMEITNNSRYYTIPLIVGRRIAQIVFFETGGIRGVDYTDHGKYQSEADTATLKEKWRPEMMLPTLFRDRELRVGVTDGKSAT